MENKLKIVFAGSPKSSSTILQSLIDNSDVEVPYVISQEPKRAKRGNKLLPTEVAIKATENDICLLYTSPSPRDVEESRMPSSA